MNILLIGFMGVGKGTIAREIAKLSNMYAIDTDDLIESLENKKIKEIFKDSGIEYFRTLERKTALWLENNVQNTIISTGGGFYNQENIKKIGKVIYLESEFEAILNRIKKHPNADKKIKKRPLLKNKKDAKKLFLQRSSDYKKVSDFIVNVENKETSFIAIEILNLLKI